MFFILAFLFLLKSPSCSEGLCFYGDILLSRGIDKMSLSQGNASIAQSLVPFLKKDAIHIGNLEGAVGDSCGCNHEKVICFPIKSPMIDLLNGFRIISLENNHSLD